MDLPDEEYYVDVFIDDIIFICFDISNNCKKICAGPCTVIEALERKRKTSCSVQKDVLLADDKNEAEGDPAEGEIYVWDGYLIQESCYFPLHCINSKLGIKK